MAPFSPWSAQRCGSRGFKADQRLAGLMPLVTLEHEAQVATVTLHRPDKRNALSPELLDELIEALDEAAGREPRALLLKGEGPVFCAGGDIGAMRDRLGDPTATRQALGRHLNPAIHAVATFPAPTVARVQGSAVGAGLGLALACDLTVAGESATLGAVHTRLGLTPDGGTSWLLTRLVGPKRALAMILEASTVTGDKAAAMGLISHAVPKGELDDTVQGLVEDLASGPTRAYLKARELVEAATDLDLATMLDREADSQALMYATEDQQEGVQAFLEDREARFQGR